MTSSTWGNMLNEKFASPKPGYAAHHLQHVGENPMYQKQMSKAFKPADAKVQIKEPKQSGGSPWHYMAGGK